MKFVHTVSHRQNSLVQFPPRLDPLFRQIPPFAERIDFVASLRLRLQFFRQLVPLQVHLGSLGGPSGNRLVAFGLGRARFSDRRLFPLWLHWSIVLRLVSTHFINGLRRFGVARSFMIPFGVMI